MLPILGCDQRKKDFLENFIFKRNENNSYQRNIDQLKKTLTIATEGSDMERQFLFKSGSKQDPRPWSIFSQNYVSIQRKIIIWSGNFLGFECLGSCIEYRPRTVIINVSGQEFRTTFSNLRNYPKSRLGLISCASSLQEIKDLCDGFIPGPVPGQTQDLLSL